jgi:hypothetical protein
MDQQTRTKYMSDISQAIYKVQNSETDLDAFLLNAKTIYSPNPAAVKFINKSLKIRRKFVQHTLVNTLLVGMSQIKEESPITVELKKAAKTKKILPSLICRKFLST